MRLDKRKTALRVIGICCFLFLASGIPLGRTTELRLNQHFASTIKSNAAPKSAQCWWWEENVALREEIDEASMFKEIGNFCALEKGALPHLQGRANRLQRFDHRRDRHWQGTGGARHSQAVTAIFIPICECKLRRDPRDLIASELFGRKRAPSRVRTHTN